MGLKFSGENTFGIAHLHLSEHPTPRNDCFYKWDLGSELCEACPSILVWWVHSDPQFWLRIQHHAVLKTIKPL